MRSTKLNLLCLLLSVTVVTTRGAEKEGYIPGDHRPVQSVQQEVTGIVTDNQGVPLPGATVLIKGTSDGVVTDFDGNFSIEAVRGDILVVTYIGYGSKEITVGDEKDITVQLDSETKELDEVVVVGFGKQKKINLSGSVTQVEDEYFQSRPITNAGEALQGSIGNLNITIPSGSPGQTPDFNIRGFESISGGAPLIVIDGVPSTPENLVQLNPNDIATVSVLKDAASSAIYGSRASFGVILVTTKTAETDKVRISAGTNFSMKKVTNLPKMVRNPYLVAKFRDIMSAPWYDLYSDEALDYAQQLSEDPGLPDVRLDDRDPTSWQYFAQTDWFDEVYNNMANTRMYNVNISQRTDKGSYFLGAESYRQEGMLKYNNDVYQRYNLRAKLDFNVTDWLSIGNNSWYNTNSYDEPVADDWLFFHNVNRQPSLVPLYNPDGSYTSSYANTIGALESGNSKTKERSFFTQFKTEIRLIPGKWKLNADASFRRTDRSNDAFQIPLEYKEGPDKINTTRKDSYVSFTHRATEQNNYNVYTTYTDTFNEKHFLNITAGFNQEEYSRDHKYTVKNGLISGDFPTVDLATGTTNTEQNRFSWATQGYFYRINYIFDDKYILETNGRYDGSSRFPKDDRWAFNPSVSAAWIVSKENFFNEDSFFNLLKFRGSYGALGNQNVLDEAGNVIPYPYIPSLNSSLTTSLLGGERLGTVTSPGLVSPTLTWETVRTVNIGADVAFFNNRLSAGFDWYRRYTEDMLTLGKDLPSTLGTREPLENAADLVTKGWELELQWKDQFNLSGKGFRYSVRFNLADNRTYIEKFDNPSGTLDNYYVGQEIGEVWGLETLGFFQSNEEVANSPDQTEVASYPSTRPVEAGDIKFADRNGDGKITKGKNTLDDPGDYRVIGNTTPRYTFGLDLTANWNNFDFRAFFQGVGKRDWYPGAGVHYFWGVYAQPWASLTENNLDHWTPETPNAYFPRPKSYAAELDKELGIPQTKYLQDASYIRMKNITIGYTLPQSALKDIGVQKLRIYLSGENLFELTDLYKYLDPEIIDDTTSYPFQRTYSLGVSLNF